MKGLRQIGVEGLQGLQGCRLQGLSPGPHVAMDLEVFKERFWRRFSGIVDRWRSEDTKLSGGT